MQVRRPTASQSDANAVRTAATPTLDPTSRGLSPGLPGTPARSSSIVRMPGQVDVVEGLAANVDAVLTGGAAVQVSDPSTVHYTVPTRTDRAIIDWERSDDGGASWRVIAHSYQDEANGLPGWRRVSVALLGHSPRFRGHRRRPGCTDARHMPATRRRRRLRRRPASPAPTTRINVLQQSALPTIVERAALGAGPHRPDGQLLGDGRPACPPPRCSGRHAPPIPAAPGPTSPPAPAPLPLTTPPRATALADNGDAVPRGRHQCRGQRGEHGGHGVGQRSRRRADASPRSPPALSVTSGSDAVFAVDARGTEALSYQWYSQWRCTRGRQQSGAAPLGSDERECG